MSRVAGKIVERFGPCSIINLWIFDRKNIPVVLHPLYSPDSALCNFFLFPRLKTVFKSEMIQDVDEIITYLTKFNLI